MEPPRTDPQEHDRAPVRAADVFTAQLLPRSLHPLLHRARLAGLFVVGMLSAGVVPAPSVHDLVVTRRDDGTEILRIPAGDPEAADVLLQSVRTELEELGPEAFLQAWAAR